MFKNPPGKREVTALSVGGPPGSRDRIYAAFGQTIQGLNKKKGAQFFLYSTVLHEDIAALYVEDLCMYTATQYSLNVFEASAKGDQVRQHMHPSLLTDGMARSFLLSSQSPLLTCPCCTVWLCVHAGV